MLKQFTLTLVIAILAAPLASAPEDDIDLNRLRMAERSTAKGDALLRKADYERAEDQFLNAIDHEARFPSAHLGLGAVMVATRRYEQALEALREAERRFVDWKAINEVAGLKNQQHYANREREFLDAERQVRASNPSLRGKTSGGSEQNEIARAAYERKVQQLSREVELDRFLADRLQPEEVIGVPAQVFYLEGLALLQLGRREEGIGALETSLVVDEGHALSHYNLAVARFTGGEVEEAAQHLRAAIDNGAEPHPQFVADLNAALAEIGAATVDATY